MHQVSHLPDCDSVQREKLKNLQESRRRFLRERCKIVEIEEFLFHGSPVQGLCDIFQHGGICPQAHGELNLDTFCVSANDNMLRVHGDEDGTTGLVFDPIKLRCIQLDWLHYHAVSELQLIYDEEWKTRLADEEIARRLDYWNASQREIYVHPGDFIDLLPPDIDGVIFPWGLCRDYACEDEISLLAPGCKKIWTSIDQIVIKDEWFDAEDGWAEISELVNQ